MEKSSKEKLCIILLKYIPVICAIVMFLHVVLLLLGIKLCVAPLTVLTLVTIMVIYWSFTLKFCLVHICSSLYTIFILWCCYIQAYIGFGEYLSAIRSIALFLGVTLLMSIISKYAEYNKGVTT